MKGFALCLDPPLPDMIPFARVPAAPFARDPLTQGYLLYPLTKEPFYKGTEILQVKASNSCRLNEFTK